jgi:multidrug resistance efflux pump
MNDIPPFRARSGFEAGLLSRSERLLPPPWPGGRLRRKAGLLAAGALVAVACFGLVQRQFTLVSEHAVVSSITIPLRTPIGGVVAEFSLTAGQEVAEGAPVVRVENDRLDRRRLIDAIAERDRAAHAVATLSTQLAALDSLVADLARRAAGRRDDAGRPVAAGAGRDVPEAGDRADAADALAARPVSSQAQEQRAGASGFLGIGGTGYLELRLDEIALHRAELTRQWATRGATLRAEAAWLTWRVLAARGQRVTAEETLAELVDCRAAFLLAAVGQRDAPHLVPGQQVRILLDGEEASRYGTVTGLMPEGMLGDGGRIALTPTRPHGGSQVVQVAMPEPPPGAPCLIGRTGRVSFDTSPFSTRGR